MRVVKKLSNFVIYHNTTVGIDVHLQTNLILNGLGEYCKKRRNSESCANSKVSIGSGQGFTTNFLWENSCVRKRVE